MTGPEHWREAEHLVTALPSCACQHSGCWHEQMQIARAQVHATLALAATQVDGAVMRPADRHEWLKAINPDYCAEQAAEAMR
jgi:hypothetical protein